MSAPKNLESRLVIPTDMFSVCKVDGVTLDKICSMYTRNDLRKKVCYKIEKFEYHIFTNYDMSLMDYVELYLKIEIPKCPVKGGRLGYNIDGRGIIFSRFNKGGINQKHCPKFAEFCKRMSVERKGEGNPMFGLDSWNKGLTKETDERVNKIAKSREGKCFLTEAGREIHRKRLLGKPGLHSMPHSEETKEKMRIHTAGLWARGVFNKTTSIHIKMREFLKTLNLKENFVEEFQVKYFSMDFAFPLAKVAIECQGTFYHVDPRIYPNGPKNAIQRRNFGRDKAKRKVCCDQEGWTIIEAWETEINDGSFKEQVLCKLKELNLLKD